MLHYQFNELDDRISELKKGQNITKTAEETAMDLDGETSMNAELIGKFITQQIAVAISEKTKQYEKKIIKYEKGGRYRVSGESSSKNSTRGGERASKKKKTSTTQTNIKSIPPQKSAYRLAQGRKIILRSPSRGRSQKAGDDESGTPGTGKKKKTARSKSASTSTMQTLKTTALNRAVGPRKGEGKLRLPPR